LLIALPTFHDKSNPIGTSCTVTPLLPHVWAEPDDGAIAAAKAAMSNGAFHLEMWYAVFTVTPICLEGFTPRAVPRLAQFFYL
jgi:hypothetical protein